MHLMVDLHPLHTSGVSGFQYLIANTHPFANGMNQELDEQFSMGRKHTLPVPQVALQSLPDKLADSPGFIHDTVTVRFVPIT
jgi:hypothetical protein